MTGTITSLLVHGGAGAILGWSKAGFNMGTLKPFGTDLGISLPFPAITAAVGVGAGLLTQIVHKYALPHLSHSKRLQNTEAAALGFGVAALGYVGMMYLFNPKNVEFMKLGNVVVAAAAFEGLSGTIDHMYSGTA